MAKFRMILAAMVALAAMAAAAHSQELLTVDDGKKGINALGVERNRWRPQGLCINRTVSISSDPFASLFVGHGNICRSQAGKGGKGV